MGSYTALYRKFRPDNFADVKGQEHITTTLKNQLKADRIGHAYLFTGTRGTGKTTVAKIFARAVNCENPTENGPCGECATCKAIAAGTSMNVIEIDAASNNGVDNIREIIDQVSYRPTEGRYKVYIIDEVHMLSTGAFNAMLKTLEEPPEYVIFILATTEVHKLPITVLSRCQRYDFRRISIDTIAARLKDLMEQENVKVEDKAIRYIAKTADGSLRDALSLLDQCIAFHLGEELTYDMALDVLGAVDTEVFSRLLRSCIDGDVHSAIALLDEVITQGRELTQFIIDFTWYLRNLMLVQTSDGLEDVVDMSTDNLARLKEEAQLAKREQIIRFIHIFSDLANQIRYASQKRVLVEIALIRLCKPAMDQDNAAILGRIDAVEKQLAEGNFVIAASAEGTPKAIPEPKPKQVLPKSVPDDVKKIVANWKKIIGNFSNDLPIAAALERAKPSLDNNGNLVLKFDAGDLSSERLIAEPGKSKLGQCLNDVSGKEIVFSISEAATNEEYESGTIDLRELIKAEIDEED
ncbi:MAG: DNA polymerase III subunit gamma/tau [Lachnospiraceae bacterium]|nr:DNA polymerase III subunit gamma/tau [Lachnospiraceae bacterium]